MSSLLELVAALLRTVPVFFLGILLSFIGYVFSAPGFTGRPILWVGLGLVGGGATWVIAICVKWAKEQKRAAREVPLLVLGAFGLVAAGLVALFLYSVVTQRIAREVTRHVSPPAPAEPPR